MDVLLLCFALCACVGLELMQMGLKHYFHNSQMNSQIVTLFITVI